MSDDGVQVKFGADISSLLGGMKDSQDAVRVATEGMKGDLGSAIEAFEKFGTTALAIGAVGLAFEGLKEAAGSITEAIEKTTQLSRTFEALNYQTGESFESLNTLNAGMLLTGGNVGELEGWMKGATRAMKANADMLVENGIAADKASLMAMPFTEYLQKVMAAADGIEEPFRRSTFLTEALGRAGAEAAPQIKRLLETLNNGEAQEAMDTFGKNIDEKVKAKMEELEKAMGRVKVASQAMDTQLATEGVNWGLAMSQMTLGFKQFEDAVVGGKSRIKDALANLGLTIFGGQTTADKQTASLLQRSTEAAATPTLGGVTTVQATPAKPIKTKEEIDEAKAAAAAAAKALEEEDAHERQMNEANAREWEALKAAAYAKDLARLELFAQIAREKAAEELAQGKATAEGVMQAAKVAIESKKVQLDQEVTLGQISQGKELELRKAFLPQEMALEAQAVEAELKNDQLKLSEKIKLQNQLQQIHAKEALEEQKINNQSALTWKKHIDGMTSQWTDGIQAMLNHTMSFHDGMRKAMLSIGDYWEKAIIQMGLDWAKGQALALMKTLTTNAATVTSQAGVAGANAIASTAAIPIVGPELAPAAGIEATSQVLAMMGLASAEGGWDRVPSDQIAQIHKNEMILPAHIAEPVRQMAASGGGGGQAVHIHAMDAKSVMKFFQKGSNQAALMRGLSGALRSGRT